MPRPSTLHIILELKCHRNKEMILKTARKCTVTRKGNLTRIASGFSAETPKPGKHGMIYCKL
jgi:hypothetical protein